MNRNHFFAKARILLPATLMFVTLNAFTQTVTGKLQNKTGGDTQTITQFHPE